MTEYNGQSKWKNEEPKQDRMSAVYRLRVPALGSGVFDVIAWHSCFNLHSSEQGYGTEMLGTTGRLLHEVNRLGIQVDIGGTPTCV